MKQITEYLTTKVTNANALDQDLTPLPKEYDYDTIVKFLIKKGFKLKTYLGSNYVDIIDSMMKMAKNSDRPILFAPEEDLADVRGNTYRYIRFCKNEKITKEHPIYLLRIGYDGYIPSNPGSGIATLEYDYDGAYQITSYEEFRKKVNNAFGWLNE